MKADARVHAAAAAPPQYRAGAEAMRRRQIGDDPRMPPMLPLPGSMQ